MMMANCLTSIFVVHVCTIFSNLSSGVALIPGNQLIMYCMLKVYDSCIDDVHRMFTEHKIGGKQCLKEYLWHVVDCEANTC